MVGSGVGLQWSACELFAHMANIDEIAHEQNKWNGRNHVHGDILFRPALESGPLGAGCVSPSGHNH